MEHAAPFGHQSCCFQWMDQPKALILSVRLGAEGTRWHRRGLWSALSRVSPTLGLHSHRKPNKNISIKTTASTTLTQIPVQQKGGRSGRDTQGRISSSAQTHLLGEGAMPVTRVALGRWVSVTGVIPPAAPTHGSSVNSDISANHMALCKNIIVFIFQFSVFCVECCCVQAKWIKA